jgi:hypothetical protein
VLAGAFSPSTLNKDAVKRGGLILEELKSTHLRPFLLEVSREYAANYLKWPVAKWPRWLQATADEFDKVPTAETKAKSASGQSQFADETIEDGGVLCF